MKRSVLPWLLVIIVLTLGGVAYVAIRNKAQAPTKTQATEDQAAKDSGIPVAGMSVVFDGESFTPGKVSVKAGQTITFTNSSSRNVQPSSDPHPSHTQNVELNVGVIAPGQIKTITVNKTGTWGYHDHLDASITGSVVVE